MKSYQRTISIASLLVSSSLFLTACESIGTWHLGPRLGIKIPIQEKPLSEDEETLAGVEKKVEGKTAGSTKFAQLDNNTDDIEENGVVITTQTYLGSGQFTGKQVKKAAAVTRTEGQYSINFDAADIGEISKIILSDMLNENYILSPKVKGTITLQTTKPLHKDELLPTLETLLRMNGAVLLKQKGIYRIEPEALGIQATDISLLGKDKLTAGYQVKVIPLEYVGAMDMVEIIKPVLPKSSIIKVDLARNLLFVAGTKSELAKAIDLVNTFDVNFLAGMSFGLYPLKNTEVATTVTDIEAIFNKGDKNPLTGMVRFLSIKHLNAILVITKQKAYLKEAEKWIVRLDQENGVVGEGGVIVYKVQHVDAVELAATLNSVITGVVSSTKNKSASVAPGQKIAKLTNKKRSQVRKKSTGNSVKSTALDEVTIIADEPNNALIILAEPQQYRMLSKVIKQLDIMPLQVMIDATIIEVKLIDNLEYGLQWAFNNGHVGNGGASNLGGLGAAATSVATAAAAASSGGFSYALSSAAENIRLTFSALAKDNKINVLSTPSLMVLNNEEATINVGNSVPIITGTTTNTNSEAITNNIQQLDTGVILKVKPRVNANGLVILDIEQKVNSALATTTDNGGSSINSPTILKREIKTTVTALDGESIVLGGLISETNTYDNAGMPLLKDIPYLGWLFGSQAKKVEKSELIVIITPRVIANKFDARKVTAEFKRKLTGIYYDEDLLMPGSDEIIRGYDGLEIQTEGQRNAPFIKEE